MMSTERMLWLVLTLASLVVLFVLIVLGVHPLLALGIAWIAWSLGLVFVGDE